MSDISELTHLSKPIEKLVDSISGAVGQLWAPIQIKRLAKANAIASLIEKENHLELFSIEQRAQERINVEKIRKQKIREDISEKAISYIGSSVSSEEVDKGWVLSYFDSAENIANDDLQILWAKILAGEISSPGTYSLRTLNILKSLSKEEADLFTRVARYFWSGSDLVCILYGDNIKEKMNEEGLNYSILADLEAAGLIKMSSDTKLFLKLDRLYNMDYFDKELGFKNNSHDLFPYPIIIPTKSGVELFNICGATFEKNVFDTVKKDIKSMGLTIF